MRGIICEITNASIDPKTVIDAHCRNAWVLAQEFGFDLVSKKAEYQRAVKNHYDVIIFSYASRYAPVAEMQKLCQANPEAKIYWLANEYNLVPNSFMNKLEKGFDVIASVENSITKLNVNAHHFFNLNTLLARRLNPPTPKKYDCIYYGTFRVNREKYFREYLQSGVHLSTSTKNFKKFKHIGCAPLWCDKLTWSPGRETLNNFRYSLYIEDDYSHENFTCLANRFYEALFCRSVQFFDRSCRATIERSGLVFDDYFYVSSHEELISKIKETNQHDLWTARFDFQRQWLDAALIERTEVIRGLKNLICTL